MAQRNGTGNTSEDPSRVTGGSAAVLRTLLDGTGEFVRSLGFWSAIVLPFVAVALLVFQPTGWLFALLSVLAVDVGALFVGHCHDREC